MATHTEGFANELRRLKERSGRSYGALAARLHVSTSTLHRYCNGAAVPGEYAPVERFARQCGATAEELVALHRLWLLADAARRSDPNRGAPRTPAATTAPADAPPADAAPAEPDAAGPAAGPAPADSDAAEPEPAEPEPAATGPDAADAPLAAPSPAPRPEAQGGRPSRRPRRTKAALAAAAAVAAVLPLALYTARGGDHPRPAAHVTRTTPGTATATAPATAVRPSGTVATTTAATAATAVPATRPPSPRATADSGKPPVQVTVLSDNWDHQCGQWFLFSQPPAKVPAPPSLQQTDAWASALGGIPAGHLRLQLTAQGLPGQPVVLNTLYVKVVSSGPAPKGSGYTPGSGCGGGIDPVSFAVDLDAAVPRAQPQAGGRGDTSTAVSYLPVQVSATESQVLDVDARTADRDVSWELEIRWTRGDRHGLLHVDDHGRPFRTVGLKGAPAYFYDGAAWSPASPDE